MNAKLLIDAIVRQTTVLIAQLSTAAGIRAPLAHVADQVFVDLARELESQGLGKKVVADMFGMMLRGYQKKVQRLTESTTVRDQTLWEAVLGLVQREAPVSRARVMSRFHHDGEEAVAAVLRDLGSSGLVFASGQGLSMVYRPTTEDDRRALFDADSLDSVIAMTWATIFHHPGLDLTGLSRLVSADEKLLVRALGALRAEGRVSADDWETFRALRAETLVVPVGSETGWEAAVFDHFRAVANAIGAKLQRRTLRSTRDDAIGGATLRFELSASHPHRDRVHGLLCDTRDRVNALWNEVNEYNAAHPISEGEKEHACFYFGQYVIESDEGAASTAQRNGAD